MTLDNAVGFYWTLPVPWTGFTELSENIDEAATQSQTIRYQAELIRRYAMNHGFELIHEEVFLEIEPDRGSDTITSVLVPVEKMCRERDATLLVVEFSQLHGSRSHHHFAHLLEQSHVPVVWIAPDPIHSAEWSFDPYAHFSDWKQRQQSWMDSKPEREARLLQEIELRRSVGLSYAALATSLNDARMLTPTGKPWTEANVRVFLKRLGAKT